ncbi:MAG: hypothetical protein AMXMBFR4_12290 [Candidatus Hydrogenedentota bacterium]
MFFGLMMGGVVLGEAGEPASLPGYLVKDGGYLPDEPYKEGEPKITGLQLPFPKMPSIDRNPLTIEKVRLGKLLFFDPILSGSNTMSCATCHHPDHGFADGRALGMGAGGAGEGPERTGGAELKRNTPTVWNAAFNHLQFWDGRAKDLEEQARGPITSADEMNEDRDRLIAELKAIPEYVELFQAAFGGPAEEAVTFDHVVDAIASFERTVLSFNSRFDRYTQGDMAALNESEKRGLKLFRSVKTRCFECHRFPHFADDTFRVIGVPEPGGRLPDEGRAEVEGQGPRFAFKVPTLRNIELTAPYMHNGIFATLEEVIDFYAQGGGRQFPNPPPGIDDKIGKFTLTEEEKADLVAFLKSLTDTSLQPDPPARVPSALPVVEVKSKAQPAPPPARLAENLAPSSDDSRLTRQPDRPRLAQARSRATYVNPNYTASAPAATAGILATFSVQPGQSIQAAIDRALPGDRIEVMPGVYHEEIIVDRAGISLIGLNVDGERPVLDGKGAMGDAVNVSGDDFLIENFIIRHYTGNGVTVSKAKNVAFRNLTIDNAGLYGVYPVECDGVLVEGCVVSRISDAGIYVGQSKNIIVRNNEAFNNVAGIEIENSVNAVVSNNSAHHNTGGILVFVLPNNPSKVGENCRVINNRVWSNNHPNFGKPGSTVSYIPPGTGILVMAADRTEITRNWIADNNSYGIAVLNVRTGSPGLELAHDLDIEPNSDGTVVADNVYSGNGKDVAGAFKAAGAPGGDLFWDGSGTDNVWREAGNLSTFPDNLLQLAAAK